MATKLPFEQDLTPKRIESHTNVLIHKIR